MYVIGKAESLGLSLARDELTPVFHIASTPASVFYPIQTSFLHSARSICPPFFTISNIALRDPRNSRSPTLRDAVFTSRMEGGQDPERADALEQYKKKLLESREMEAKLKTLRIDIKGLQKDFDTTEDNIKALQSVGQIIGEVLKQLDEERCKTRSFRSHPLGEIRATWWQHAEFAANSHRQSILWSQIRRWLSIKGRPCETKTRHTCGARHDYFDDNAYASSGS